MIDLIAANKLPAILHERIRNAFGPTKQVAELAAVNTFGPENARR
jgi:hypothetical protein